MSYFDYPNKRWVEIFTPTVLELRLGKIQIHQTMELSAIKVDLIIKDVTALSNAKIRINIYNVLYNKVLHTSSWVYLKKISDLGASDWIGFIRLEFARELINENLEYGLALEIDDYVGDGINQYVGLFFDDPEGIYNNNNVPDIGLKFEFFGYEL
jgi:hypothetical protein